jgi:hypothetical protein
MNLEECVIIFRSVSYAIKFEKTLKKYGRDVKMIPVPRSLSSSCGMCGKFQCEIKEDIEKICYENKIEYEGIYAFRL